MLFPVSETHFFTLIALGVNFLFLPMIFLDEVKEAGNYQSFSIYLVFYDMYICVPSDFIDENFTNYFFELMLGRSRLHTNQKLVSLFFSVVEKPFFRLLF